MIDLRKDITSANLVKPYTWCTIFAGGLIYFIAAYRLDQKMVDVKLGVLVLITLFLTSRITIKIPQFSSYISVSDTFIFLTLLLYGCEAAILMAATEALLTSFRSDYCRKPTTILFNWACAAWAVCVTSYSLNYFFEAPVRLNSSPLSARYISAIGLMALVQYAANSGVVAVLGALKAKGNIW